MPERMKTIIESIIEDFHINCKRVRKDNLQIEGRTYHYNTPHIIYRYMMRNIGKAIYFEYDEYRNFAREVMVYDL